MIYVMIASAVVNVVMIVLVLRLRQIAALYRRASELDRHASIQYRRAAELQRERADLCWQNTELLKAHLAALTRASA